ncbi:hypothetical protein Tco_0806632 [Tanacetum coccineum]
MRVRILSLQRYQSWGKLPSSSRPKPYAVPYSTSLSAFHKSDCSRNLLGFNSFKLIGWSPTGRFFDLQGKIITSSESESQSDFSKGDNAFTSNPQEPINKRFPSSTFSMSGCQKWFDTMLIPLLSEYNLEDKEDHGDNECDT